MKFFKDGQLQGWVVASAWTVLTMVLLTFGFFNPTVQQGWIDIGRGFGAW